MKIYLTSDEIKKLTAFTTKAKTRQALTGMCFSMVNNRLEIAATDGGALLLLSRPLKDEEVPPEGKTIVILPKAKYKNTVCIDTDELPGKVLLSWPISGYEKGQALGEVYGGTFPNYNAIIPADLEELPLAEKYAAFSVEKWKMLQEASPTGGITDRPRAANANTPHFWSYDWGINGTMIVVMMPMKLTN